MSGVLPNEGERLKALLRYQVLDTPPEPEFDRIAARAASLLGAPVAILSLVGETRIWFKARQGFPFQELGRSGFFCEHAILADDVLVVADATRDPRFAGHALVTGTPGLHFYAGAPLRTRDGLAIGTLAVLDLHARTALAPEQAAALQALATLAMDELEMRLLAQTVAEREAERQEGNRLFAAVFEAAPFGLVVTDETGRIIVANEALCRMLGVTPEEIGARPLAMTLAPEALSGSPETALAEAVRGAAEWRIERPDGAVVKVRAATAPLPREDGREWRITALTDISESRLREQHAQQLDRVEALSRMAGKVAHDFNNLLMIINGFSQLIKSSVDARDPLAGFADEILKATTRASVLTGRFLVFSGRRVGKPQAADLNGVVTNIASLIGQSVGPNIEVVTSLQPALRKISADPGHLGQLVMNLAENAKEAMPAGGRLAIETSNIDLTEEFVHLQPAARQGSYVLLRVTDTGPGLAPDARARLFEPFFTTKGAGRGIGLALVYGIVKQSGGYVDVSSEPGQGTTVLVYLPAAPAAKPKAQPRATVLLVDYDDALRKPTRMMLEELGCKVLEAATADQAIEVAEQQTGPIHVLLTEVVIPGRTGPELAERLRGARPELKVLYTCAHGMVEEALPEKGAQFLRKPVSIEALASKLREILYNAG